MLTCELDLFVCAQAHTVTTDSQLMAISSLRAHDFQLRHSTVNISIITAVLHVAISCCVLTTSGGQQRRWTKQTTKKKLKIEMRATTKQQQTVGQMNRLLHVFCCCNTDTATPANAAATNKLGRLCYQHSPLLCYFSKL